VTAVAAGRACDGLRVLDLGQGMAGALAGMILADNGAEVLKVEPPAGDWARGRPGFLMWNRNKRGIVLDLKDGADRDRLLALADHADVVIESFRPGVSERLGIGWPDLRARNPRLVHCSVTGFGPAPAGAGLPGYEGLVSAAIGRMVGLDHLNGAVAGQDREAPIFTAAPVASYGAAQLAVQGVLAALAVRARTGQGDRVRTSLVQGAAAFLMRQELPRGGTAGAPLVSAVTHAGIELCFMTARCRDGRFIQMCARQDAHFRNWLSALGLAGLHSDPRFAGAPLGMSRIEDVAELDRLLRERMSGRTRDEWMELFTTEYDVGADPFLTAEEFLSHPQLVSNGRVVELDDPGVGRCRQLGPLVLLSDTPSRVEHPAPGLGQHTVQEWHPRDPDPVHVGPTSAGPTSAKPASAGPASAKPASAGRTSDGPGSAHARPGRLPLDRVTVVELAYYVAGPAAGSLLAELGARVIKVEPLDGDPYRRTGLQAAKFLHGKESIALDLKAPAGVAILHRLVAGADMFVHSFRPGVPERLGVDYPTLSALNPDLIYLYAASYGSKGPQARRAAFHSTPNALSGAGIVQAGTGNPPVDDSFPDTGSGLGAATALLLGLHARARTGRGQALETTMLASTGYIMSPWLVRYDGLPEPPTADRGQHGLGALYRLYRCAEGWVFVSCVREDEWRSLAVALGRAGWLDDGRFARPADRAAHDAELATLIAARLATRTAGAWAAHLGALGVPVVRASEEPQEVWFERQGLLREASHPVFGDYWRLPPKVEFASVGPDDRPAAAVGEHSLAILASLGYPDDEIAALRADGVVGCWPEPADIAPEPACGARGAEGAR
jgi:crotonobetainyl-CoA:carnitine CoA-transferase CaiB-like acyl-CoA transferase